MSGSNDILLVEDSVLDRELTIAALRDSKLANEIHIAKDGEEALDFLFCRGAHQGRSFATPPRVVLLDLNLPKVDGLEVLKAIRGDAKTKAIPVVMFTSSTREEHLAEGHRLGVNAFIEKPVDIDRFREVILNIGLFWMVVNRPIPAQLFCEFVTPGAELEPHVVRELAERLQPPPALM